MLVLDVCGARDFGGERGSVFGEILHACVCPDLHATSVAGFVLPERSETLMRCVLFARGVHVDVESVSSRESAQRWGEEALWLVMQYTYDANILAS